MIMPFPDRTPSALPPWAAIAAVAAIFLIPAISPANWPNPLSDSSRTSWTSGTGDFNPPIAIRGTYGGTFGLLSPGLLVDHQRVYVVSGRVISALERIEDTDLPEKFDVSSELWTYEPDEDLSEGRMRRIGSPSQYYPSQMVSLAPGNRIVFVEEETNFFDLTQSTTWLVALHRATGQEVWRYELPQTADIVLNVLGQTAFVRYRIREGGDFDLPFAGGGGKDSHLDGRLARIEIGADAPTAEVPIQQPGNNPDLVYGGRWYLMEGDRISAFSPYGLERLWTFPHDDGTLRDLSEGGQVQNLVADQDRLYLTLDEDRVLALSAAGELLWSQHFPGRDCHPPLRLSLHPDMLVVSGLCEEEIMGLDPATGEVRWHRLTDQQVNLQPPIVVGGFVYMVSAGGDSGTGTIIAYDVHSGEIVNEAPAFLDNAGTLSPMAVRDDYLFAGSVGTFGSTGGRVALYETEPADLSVDFAGNAEERFACEVPMDSELPLWVDVYNNGPGTAPDAVLRVRAQGVPVTWRAAAGVDHEINGQEVTVRLGDLAVNDLASPLLYLTPDGTGELVVEASARSHVRTVDAENAGDAVVVEVGDSVPEDLDLSVDWVEVTQGLQDSTGSIALIAGKPTLLRVYVETNRPISAVRAVMHIKGSTSGASWSRDYDLTVASLESCLSFEPGVQDRSDLGSTFNFLVPLEMMEGEPDGPFEAEIVIDPDNLLQEANRENNVWTEQISFDVLPPICLVTHRVRHYTMGGGETRGPRFYPDDHIERAVSMLPVRDIFQYTTGNTVERLTLLGWAPYELDPGGKQQTTRILNTLWLRYNTTRTPALCRGAGIDIHAGVVATNNLSTRSGSNFNGIARRPGRQQVNRVRNGSDGVNDPAGGRTIAHEIGHNFGRRHVDCNNPRGPDRNYPYAPCQFAPISPDGNTFFGVDLMDPHNPQVITPLVGTGDLLSYAGTRWTSDYTWSAMRTYLLQNSKRHELRKAGIITEHEQLHREWLARWKGSEGKNILVTASLDEEGIFVLEDVLPLGAGIIPEEKGLALVEKNFDAMDQHDLHTVELLDGQGGVILSVPAGLELAEDSEPPVYTMNLLVPMPDGVAAIRVVDEDGTPVAQRDRSPAPPEVELTEPQAGSVAEDFLVVDWTASDPDGGELTALIQYSDDDGETWVTVATDAGEGPVVLEADFIPGAVGTGRVRLIVNDGFNSTEVTSESFTLVPGGPVPNITRPKPGESFALGEPIIASGRAYDPEDGPLTGDALTWELNGAGGIGFGRHQTLRNLPAGTYTLALTASDSSGETATDEVNFTVAARQATQAEIAGVLTGLLGKAPDLVYDLSEDDAVDSADVQKAAP